MGDAVWLMAEIVDKFLKNLKKIFLWRKIKINILFE